MRWPKRQDVIYIQNFDPGSSLHYIVTFYLFNNVLAGVNVFIVWTLLYSTKKFRKVFGDLMKRALWPKFPFLEGRVSGPGQLVVKHLYSVLAINSRIEGLCAQETVMAKLNGKFPVRPGPTEKSFPIGKQSIVLSRVTPQNVILTQKIITLTHNVIQFWTQNATTILRHNVIT